MTVEYLHMIVTGEWITEKLRRLFMEHRLSVATEIFEQLRPIPTQEQQRMVLLGDAEFEGATICDKPDCLQCKGLTAFVWTNKENKRYKAKLVKHQKWIDQYFVKIDGDMVVEKDEINSVIEAEAQYQEIRSIRNKDFESKQNMNLKRKLSEMDDLREQAYDYFYKQFGIQRDIDYKIGSYEWKMKLKADSVLEIIKAKAVNSKELSEMLEKAKEIGKEKGYRESKEGLAQLFYDAFGSKRKAEIQKDKKTKLHLRCRLTGC